ncbi:hypothetical protein BH11PLA1_BH11PLA1_12700 [soil metagenome]
MTSASFIAILTTQALLALLAGTLAAAWIARRPRPLIIPFCIAALALMFACSGLWVFSVEAVHLLGAPAVACLETTAMAIPACLMLGIAARALPRRGDRRALAALAVLAGIYFLSAGRWMLTTAPVSPVARWQGGVCIQTTDATCTAAAAATALTTLGILTSEADMARLNRVDSLTGASDARVLWGIQQRLEAAGSPVRAEYRRFDYLQLVSAPKPCLTPIDWSFMVSHMVAVLDADAEGVTLGDPSGGLRRVPRAEFEAIWKRRAITLPAALVRAPADSARPVAAAR